MVQKIKTQVWSFKEQSSLLLHSGTSKLQNDSATPDEKYWERTVENKVTFVRDWLIDGSHFIVEQPVGHMALSRNLAHMETAVSENAAWCQLWQYLCSHWGRVCVNLCPPMPSAGVFLLYTASKLFHKQRAAAEAQHWAALLERGLQNSQLFLFSQSPRVEMYGRNTKKYITRVLTPQQHHEALKIITQQKMWLSSGQFICFNKPENCSICDSLKHLKWSMFYFVLFVIVK